ncbi:hypothetical protein Leryth_027262 [Lithospermum erythrorhizon]|nr:hypothetical protein Leryth_027262 [Lithospermum erythrorhizon]
MAESGTLVIPKFYNYIMYKKIKKKNKEEPLRQGDLGLNVKNQDNLGSVLLNQQKGIEEYDAESNSKSKKHKKKKQYKVRQEAEIGSLRKTLFCFFSEMGRSFESRIINNIKVYCLLLRLNNPEKLLSSIQQENSVWMI